MTLSNFIDQKMRKEDKKSKKYVIMMAMITLGGKNIALFWTDNVILVVFSIFAYKKLSKTYYCNRVLKKVFIVVILLLNIFVVKEKINDIYISKGYNKSLIVQEASIYYYHYEDAKDYFSSIFMKQNEIKKLYQENGIEYTEVEDFVTDVHIPFGIKIPGIDKKDKITRAVSKIDIKPTILDLLGVEDKFSMGKTLFSQKDYSFIKGLGYVTSKNYYINGKYYDRETLAEIEETEELQKLLQKMEDEIYLSDTIIKNNLIETYLN